MKQELAAGHELEAGHPATPIATPTGTPRQLSSQETSGSRAFFQATNTPFPG